MNKLILVLLAIMVASTLSFRMRAGEQVSDYQQDSDDCMSQCLQEIQEPEDYDSKLQISKLTWNSLDRIELDTESMNHRERSKFYAQSMKHYGRTELDTENMKHTARTELDTEHARRNHRLELDEAYEKCQEICSNEDSRLEVGKYTA